MPDRRSLLVSLATAAALTSGAGSSVRAIGAPERLTLWPDYPPGGGGPHGGVARDASGAVSNVALPWLDVFRPENPNGVAVLIAGGGGYTRIGIVKEAYPAAFWLTSEGITAFVMTYRLPREGWDDGPVVSLQDAQRGLRLIRANAKRFGIDPGRVGVMGFSAGGHLAGMAAARHDFRSYRRLDAVDEISARPDFSTLLYPVVSMQPPFDQTTTRRSLVGEDPSAAAAEEWSIQTYVKAGNPSTFLVQADDDTVISPEHSCVLDEACRGAGVPIEYHRFARGGHGFGVGRSDAPVSLWPKLCRLWLSSVSVLG